uniref:Selenoprotein J n=1 Tax=Haplochromis burtoni TaxID=8153 RepID=A0A3Q2WHL4_HAPBU
LVLSNVKVQSVIILSLAAQPLHWVYDLQKLKGILALNPNPEFHPESANPFYRRETGKQSCYGDQAYVLLESLSECGGLNIDDLKQRTLKVFGPGSEYDTPVNDPYRERGELPEECGCCENDCQIDGIAKLAPIVAFYAGQPDMLEKVEQAIRVTQNNDECVAETLAAARFLEHFILNGPDPKALDAVLNQLNDPNRKQPQDLDKAVIGHIHQVKENLSKTPQEKNAFMPFTSASDVSGLPGAFQAALHGVLTATRYETAVRDTMSCGGCTCSRGSFIGACLGAQVGLSGIPESWKSKTLQYDLVLEHTKKITKHLSA